MSHESRFRENDPARDLPPLGHEHKRDLAIGAIAAEPRAIKYVHRRRSPLFVGAAAAAALLIALPIMQPWQGNSGPAKLMLAGMGNSNSEGYTAQSGNQLGVGDRLASTSAKVPAFYNWGYYQFTSEVALSDEGSTALAYEMSVRDDAKQIVNAFADLMGVANPEFYEQGDATVSSPKTDSQDYNSQAPQISAYLSDSWSSVSYYNESVWPWKDVVCNGSGVDERCEPTPATDLPTNAEVKSKVLSILQQIGISTATATFEINRDDYGVNVNVHHRVGELADPAIDYFYFVDKGALQNAAISLNQYKAVGTYDLVSPKAALERLNAMNRQYYADALESWQQSQAENGDGSGTSGSSEGSTGAVEPSEETGAPAPDTSTSTDPGLSPEPAPSVTTKPTGDPGPTFPGPQLLSGHVTSVKLSGATYTLKDGRTLLIPTYDFYGYYDTPESNPWPIANVVAVVDSQIDLSDFMWGGGVMPMLRGAMY